MKGRARGEPRPFPSERSWDWPLRKPLGHAHRRGLYKYPVPLTRCERLHSVGAHGRRVSSPSRLNPTSPRDEGGLRRGPRRVPRAELRPQRRAPGRRGRGRGRAGAPVPVGAERLLVPGRQPAAPSGLALVPGASGRRRLPPDGYEGLLLAAGGAGAHVAPPPARLQSGDPPARHRLHLGPPAGVAAPAGRRRDLPVPGGRRAGRSRSRGVLCQPG